MRRLAYRLVDVFAEAPLTGNPLAVFTDAEGLPDELMQRIANETNLSETTFVIGSDGDGHRVRIFTPAEELPFAGHPTIGTAAILGENTGRASLHLGVGEVRVARDDEGLWWFASPEVSLGETLEHVDASALTGLGVGDFDPDFPVQRARVGPEFTLLPLAGLDALRRCDFNLAAHRARFGEDSLGAVYPFVRGGESADDMLTSRLLFDACGVREDPATGSAAACLAAYLSEHAYFGGDELAVTLSQGRSIGRPSAIHLQVESAGGQRHIEVGGRVQPVASGHFELDV